MTATAAQPRRWAPSPADVVDVFVYVVVLNLAAEYVPLVITETFTLSLLTALLLKATLEVVVFLRTGPSAGSRLPRPWAPRCWPHCCCG